MAGLFQEVGTSLSADNRSRVRNARLAVMCAIGTLAVAGISAFLVSATGGDGGSADLAAAGSRDADDRATRGALRSPLDQNPTVASPTDEPQPTTTTSAPVTTTSAAPSTTTTAAEAPKPAPKPTAPRGGANSQSGKASYYDYKSGGCAHKTIAKGTKVTVTNTANGKSTTCTVNDRGPFVAGRIIDLETDVFKQIASTSAGVATVKISW